MHYLSSWRGRMLLAITAIAVGALIAHGPIAQDLAYHQFADQRSLFGIGNFWNVVTNLPFLLVGLYGLVLIRRAPPGGLSAQLRPAYAAFFVGLVFLAPASAWYHLVPGNDTLLWDRLPITVVFMALFSAILGEHLDPSLARRALPVFLALGVASLVWWTSTGDLRLYVLVQFLPLLLAPLVIAMFPSPLPSVGLLWAMFGVYALAKAFEALDAPIYAALGISGHSLKHLAACLAVCLIAFRVRRCVEPARPA